MSRPVFSDQARGLRLAIIVAMIALAVLCIAWETFLAPLREGAWMLSIKALPVLMSLPGIIAGKIRTVQWWSMLILIYLAEGLVRATTETGIAANLAIAEVLLSVFIFGLVLVWCKIVRAPASEPAVQDRTA